MLVIVMNLPSTMGNQFSNKPVLLNWALGWAYWLGLGNCILFVSYLTMARTYTLYIISCIADCGKTPPILCVFIFLCIYFYTIYSPPINIDILSIFISWFSFYFCPPSPNPHPYHKIPHYKGTHHVWNDVLGHHPPLPRPSLSALTLPATSSYTLTLTDPTLTFW